MEKAVLRDLGKLNEFHHRHNLLKLIKNKIDDPYQFDENTGDFLIKFYGRQIINSLETLDQNNYAHFDIKLDNLLMNINLNIKLTDFSLLRKISDSEEKFKLPGGTQGYITPEYYLSKNVTIDVARKQDYFALGSCLFYLKFGIPLLRYKKYEDTEMNADRIIDILLRNINYLKTNIFTDKDFIKFIIKLLSFKPEDRPTFQQIYRNKWVNKDIDILDKTIMAFENDEEKLILELQKKDYLIKKEIENKIKENKNNYKTKKYKFCRK